jgi:hypothetical protein
MADDKSPRWLVLMRVNLGEHHLQPGKDNTLAF